MDTSSALGPAQVILNAATSAVGEFVGECSSLGGSSHEDNFGDTRTSLMTQILFEVHG
jgi:hypothetical protein